MVQMKIKYLLLLLVVSGIIIISGCLASEKQPSTSKDPGSIQRSFFDPYFGSLEHRGSQSELPPQDPFMPQPGSESMYNLTNATTLLDRNIQKADVTIMRIEDGIQRQKAEGKDVSKVEALLEQYKLLIEKAKEYRALADKTSAEKNNSSVSDSKLEDNSSENLKREYLIKSQNYMIQSNDVLKEIFRELQHLRPGNEQLNNTSRLKATGDGMVNLMGNLTLNLHLEEGEMAIPNLSEDAEIYINGDYVFEEKNDIQGSIRLYRIQSADVKISGSRKAVMLRGKNITLTADGEGYVTLLGNGTYSIEDANGTKKKQKWAHPFFKEEGMNPGGKRHGSSDYGPDGKNQDIIPPAEERINNTMLNPVDPVNSTKLTK